MKICRDGWPFVGICALVAVILVVLASHFESAVAGTAAGVCFLAAAFCAYFFRDPTRQIRPGDQWIRSPADGKVMEIVEGTDSSSAEPVWIIRIFLSVFEPHLQRAPMRGRVTKIRYTKGKFLDARDPQAAFENEQNRIEIVPTQGAGTVVVTQIAGLIARRILCWVREGQVLEAGERIGLIRFGSQVDMVLPKSAKLRIKAGDHVTAGDTIIGEI